MPESPPAARDDWLCERCGYPLKGVETRPDAHCPECGLAVDESRPHRRIGPAWQNHPSPRAWLATAAAVLGHPRDTFRTMRLDGSNLPPRLFLLSMALGVGTFWGIFTAALGTRAGLMSWAAGMVAGKLVLVMSYIEAGGVAFFSGRRGWRVPFHTAERVTGYASVGWLLAAFILAGLNLLERGGFFDPLLDAVAGPYAEAVRPVLGLAALGLAILGFETLVWTGVRAVRFGNRPRACGSRPIS
jgi:hypothetical protein